MMPYLTDIRQSPTLDAAAVLLADAWGPALAASHRLGWHDGHRRGHAAAEADMAASWHDLWLHVQATMRSPRHAELIERRRLTHDPCPARCGRCSACIHAEHAAANLARYGRPDYPGATR